MSATKAHHHDTIEAATRPAYNPRTIDNLAELIKAKIETGQQLAAQLAAAQTLRVFGQEPELPVRAIREQLDRLHEEITLDLVELDRRRI